MKLWSRTLVSVCGHDIMLSACENGSVTLVLLLNCTRLDVSAAAEKFPLARVTGYLILMTMQDLH